ncbi:DUF418 domain-containing protein [Lacimicrobium alkaliphilum]|uniref:DUF418 domain-containing protein n=1 Tax=Lacimicrobium alkaliphilum TaxID=1526571 RepID=A0A0U3B1D4_9ALTE|nr:DUF418 domain-containing protein [Lacimicrobium alkaliphilum]ALS97305.1 hypothetical protein AT746_02800 [Lacimicrobium alkaliphilum]
MINTINTGVLPASSAERIVLLDAVRGFALLGILLMNIEYFQRPLQAIMLGFDTQQQGMDYAVAWFSFTFVQGKFYTLFSFLFGLGFVVFMDRAMQKGRGARMLFLRRLVILLMVGVAHLLLIWGGDILHLYGLLGLLLLFFVNSPVKRLWKWGLAFNFVIPVLILWLGVLALQGAMSVPETAAQMQADFEQDRVTLLGDIVRADSIYASGSYWQAVQWRMDEWYSMYLDGGLLFFGLVIFGAFLIGAAFGRAGVFADLSAHRALFKRLMLWGYGLGVPATLIWGVKGQSLDPLYPTVEYAAMITVSQIANLALCLAYIGSLSLLFLRGAKWVAYLAPAGRMALTNYLLQSVVFTLLFYGYGLGLYGEYGRAETTLMALAFYALQLWLSHLWLQRFRMGPMEWCWRVLTYGKIQPARG